MQLSRESPALKICLNPWMTNLQLHEEITALPQLPSVRGPDPILEQAVKVELRQQVRRDEVSQDGEQLLPVALSACTHGFPGSRCGAPGTAAAPTRRGGTRRASSGLPLPAGTSRHMPVPAVLLCQSPLGAAPRALGTGALGRRPQRPLNSAPGRAPAPPGCLSPPSCLFQLQLQAQRLDSLSRLSLQQNSALTPCSPQGRCRGRVLPLPGARCRRRLKNCLKKHFHHTGVEAEPVLDTATLCTDRDLVHSAESSPNFDHPDEH